MTKNEYKILCEAYGLNETRLPTDGSDPEYGIPEEEKYPLWDKSHVESAIKFFHYANPQYKESLADKIIGKMREYGIPSDTVGEDNPLREYLKENEEIKLENQKPINNKEIVGMEMDKAKANFKSIVPEKNIMKEEVDPKLTEVLCNLREDLRGELDAILNYDKRADIAEKNGYADIARVLRSIRDEEKIHCGELEALLDKYDSNMADKVEEGRKEAAEEGNLSEDSKAVNNKRKEKPKSGYTDYGYIGKDGIEYASEEEAYEAERDNESYDEAYKQFVTAVRSMNLSENEKKSFKKHLMEFKRIRKTWNNRTLTESELDPINKTRCPDIFDKNEKMHPEVKKFILELLNKFKKECPYDFKAGRIILIGSSTGYQYTLTSDIDINFETTLTDEQRNEVYPMIPHNIMLPGTNRPVNVFCVTNGNKFDASNAENMYDIIHDKWLKRSEKNTAVLPYQYIKDLSRFFIDGSELALSRYHQDKQELEIYMSLDLDKHDVSQKEKADKVAQKLVDLKNDVDALHLIHHIIYAFRGEGFNGQLFKVNIEMANQENPRYSPNNLVYKMIDRFGYLEKINDACKDGAELIEKVEKDAGEDADASTKA